MKRVYGSRALGAISWVLLAAGLTLVAGSAVIAGVGAYQTATFRQPGVRTPWQPEPLELTAAPGAARAAGAAMPLRTDAIPPAVPEAVASTAVDDAPETVLDAPPEAPAEAILQAAPAMAEAVPARHGGIPSRLRIPSIGVDSAVVELGITVKGEWELPNEEVGWYRHTTLPGAAGNAVFAGHLNDVWGLPRVFARLKDVKLGDVIEVDSAELFGQGMIRQRYVVAETKQVPSTAVEVMDPTEDTRITLITCSGIWNVGRSEYSHRHIVIAKLVEPATTPGRLP